MLDEGVATGMGITLGRMGEPHEVTAAAAFLLSPQTGVHRRHGSTGIKTS